MTTAELYIRSNPQFGTIVIKSYCEAYCKVFGALHYPKTRSNMYVDGKEYEVEDEAGPIICTRQNMPIYSN